MVVGEAAEAGVAAWVAAMALIPEENVNLIGTAAVTNRKQYIYFFPLTVLIYRFIEIPLMHLVLRPLCVL